MNSLYKEKIQQAAQYLNESNVDSWLIYSSESSDPSIDLLTGTPTVGNSVLILTKVGQLVAICNSIDAQDLVESNLFDEVVIYYQNLEEELVNTIQKLGPSSIALNRSVEEKLADGLTEGRYRWIKKTLQDTFSGQFVSSDQFLAKLRSIKTESERMLIKKAIDYTIDIYDEVIPLIQAGMTEKQVGALFVDKLIEKQLLNGVDRTLSMPIVMKNNIAHRAPSDAVIEKGDLVIVDFSVAVEGYVSDIARTFYVLKDDEEAAPAHIQRVFDDIHTAITMAGEKIKPGVLGYEVDEVARSYYLSKSYPAISHATGHQIGKDVHDGGVLLGPQWPRYGKAPYGVIDEGMVFTIEPTIFMDDGIHFIVEENVVVKAEGIEYLSRRQAELILIGKKLKEVTNE